MLMVAWITFLMIAIARASWLRGATSTSMVVQSSPRAGDPRAEVVDCA
jgi:hypothetical protein